MKYLFTPRFNWFDLVGIAVNTVLFDRGNWAVALLSASIFSTVSAVMEYRTK